MCSYSIDLPQIQHDLAAAVAAVGKPTAMVLLNGGMVSITQEKANTQIGAIIEAFYPGTRGAEAIVDVIFGDYNPGGKLPITIYDASIVNVFNMFEMDMSVAPGRTYRFFQGQPTYPFGWGLSFTNFSIAWSGATPQPASIPTGTGGSGTPSQTYTVSVTNTGPVAGDEVVQCYYWPQNVPLNTPLAGQVPLIKDLCGYQRITLQPGQTSQVSFTIDAASMPISDRVNGDVYSAPGSFLIQITNGVNQAVTAQLSLTGQPVVINDDVSRAAKAVGGLR